MLDHERNQKREKRIIRGWSIATGIFLCLFFAITWEYSNDDENFLAFESALYAGKKEFIVLYFPPGKSYVFLPGVGANEDMQNAMREHRKDVRVIPLRHTLTIFNQKYEICVVDKEKFVANSVFFRDISYFTWLKKQKESWKKTVANDPSLLHMFAKVQNERVKALGMIVTKLGEEGEE